MGIRPLLLAAAFLLGLVVQSPHTRATDAPPVEVKKPRVVATLVADHSSVAPGDTIRVGVRYKLDPKWHIYWRYPGDTGLVTELELRGPEGTEVGSLRWPAPERYETSTGLVNYGYGDEVILHAQVKLPAELPGDEVRVFAKTSWLVCEVNCIPGKAKLSLALPVGASQEGPDAPAIAAAEASVPVDGPAGLKLSPALKQDGIQDEKPFHWSLKVEDEGGLPLSDVLFVPEPGSGVLVKRTDTLVEGEGVPAGGALIALDGSATKAPEGGIDTLKGLLRFKRGDATTWIRTAHVLTRLTPVIEEAKAPSSGESPASAPPAPSGEPPSMPLMFLFALIGGLILNIMPCVLPVLSIKVLGLVQQAGDDDKTILGHGIAYTLGILLSFGGMGGVMIAVQASGEAIGWGFQMQDPAFVAGLAALIFAFGLNLFGVFEVQLPGSGKLDSYAAAKHGVMGSFVNGVLATVLATPCTAPFLAPALGFAVSQPPVTLLLLLLTVGFGLALPFLLAAMFPAWAGWLPKPGAWMMTFKKAMGFLLIGTTIWLLDVLGQQLSRDGLWGFLAFLGTLGFASWIYGHWGDAVRPTRTRIIGQLVALAVVILGGTTFVNLEPPAEANAAPTVAADTPAVVDGEIQWRDFAVTDVEALADAGDTVFVDFTAAWCATCKVYEATVIDTDEVKSAFMDNCVVPVKADWTRKGPEIGAWLKRFGRPGVPMYLLIPANRSAEPLLLPDLLTVSSILDGLKKTGPSTRGACGG